MFIGIDDLTGTTLPTTVTSSVTVNMGAGNDTLVIAGVTAPTLNIADTLGNNTITIGSGLLVGGGGFTATTVGSDLHVTTGAGNDTINIAGVDVTGKLELFPGNGTNTCMVNGGGGVNTTVSVDLEYHGGAGVDSLVIGNPNPLIFDGTVTLGRNAQLNMGKGLSNTLSVNPLASLGVGALFSATAMGTTNSFNLDTISPAQGFKLSLSGVNDTVNLLNLASASGGLTLLENGTGTNVLSVSNVIFGIMPKGTFVATMGGKVANTIVANNWFSVRLTVTGVKGAANNANLLNTFAVFGPLVFKNFAVVGP